MVKVRQAAHEDADGMSRVLGEILDSWKSKRPRTPEHVLNHYIASPNSIRCSVAVNGADQIIGFQSLQIARPGNPFDLPDGWGVIGTYVSLNAPRNGIGKALFASTLEAAQEAGLKEIDATIGADNEPGLAYYEAMGFRSYRQIEGADCKRFEVPES